MQRRAGGSPDLPNLPCVVNLAKCCAFPLSAFCSRLVFFSAQKTALPQFHHRPKVTLMLAKVCSAAVNGIEACPVEVEVNSGWGDTLIGRGPGILTFRFVPAFVRTDQSRV